VKLKIENPSVFGLNYRGIEIPGQSSREIDVPFKHVAGWMSHLKRYPAVKVTVEKRAKPAPEPESVVIEPEPVPEPVDIPKPAKTKAKAKPKSKPKPKKSTRKKKA
jgi:hypothetical protein